MRDLQKLRIGGKNVYVFKDHATALAAWADYRRQEFKKPNLITLDCHTDTHSAFIGYICEQTKDYYPKNIDELRDSLCGEIKFENTESVELAVSRLRNDEHIDTAVQADIINYVFIISYFARHYIAPVGPLPTREKYEVSKNGNQVTLSFNKDVSQPEERTDYKMAENKIYEIAVDPGFEPPPEITEEEELRLHCNAAIEKHYLDCKLDIANLVGHSIGVTDILSEDFILDIDLDYFRTEKSIAPEDPTTFYEMVRKSKAITIALEPRFVIYERVEGETITSEDLFPKLMKHIENALGTSFE